MKRLQKSYLIASFLLLGVLFFSKCTKDNQVLDVPQVINSSTDLVSVKVTTAPTLDGIVDAMWENSPKLKFEAVVPDPTGDLFRSYVGNVVPSVTVRSAYTNDSIYFLTEWVDPTQSLIREPWYFDPVTKMWEEESGLPTFSATGTITRKAFYEDKFAMLWNINNSVSGWNNGTCYKSCHTGLSAADGFGRHRTNNASERIDMWHWKSVRTGISASQMDDQYQYDAYPNGRTNDDKTSGGDATNSQNLVITGSSPAVTVTVPKYVIPGRTNYNWILRSEIDNGTAKVITAVDANGVLTLSDATTIDPNTDVAFQRNGAGVGAKVIPLIYTSPFIGSRGDINAKATYTGTGWIVEISRALKTADTKKQDVDFSSLENQYFGMSFFDGAQIAHAIKPNLVLKFKK